MENILHYKKVYAQVERYTSLLPFVGSDLGMPKRPQDLSNTTKIFSANINRLLDHYKETPTEAAVRCKTSQQQMDRITKCKQSPTLDTLHKIARGYNMEAYQLLIPNLNPKNLSLAIARDLYQRIREGAALLKDLDEADNQAASGPTGDDRNKPGTRLGKKDPNNTTKGS